MNLIRTILTVGTPTATTGRTYDRAEIIQQIEQFNSDLPVFGIPSTSCERCVDVPKKIYTDLSQVSHIVEKLELVGDDVVAHIKVLTTPQGQILRQLLDGDCDIQFSPVGTGKVNADKIVTEYNLTRVYYYHPNLPEVKTND